MAITATLVTSGGLPYRVVGNQRETTTEVVFDSSYESEGEPFTASQFGLNMIEGVPDVLLINGSENESEFPVDVGFITLEASGTKGKIRLINAKTSKEVASTKNVEKVKALVTARGR